MTARGEGGGAVGIEAGVEDVGAHDHVAETGGDEALEGDEFFFGPGGGDVDEAEVGVAGGAAVAGEVFRAGEEDAVGAVGADVFRSVAHRDGLGIGGEAAALALDDRVVGVGVEVDDGGEIRVRPWVASVWAMLAAWR